MAVPGYAHRSRDTRLFAATASGDIFAFGESLYSKDEIEKGVRELGALVEWSSENLLAVDATEGETAARVFEYLRSHHEKRHLQFEIGKWTTR